MALGRAGVVYVEPGDGKVLGEGSRGTRAVFRVVEDWHRWLAASGEWRATGRAVTGACTLAFLVLTLTGPFLWWPRQWSRAHLVPITWFQRGLRGRPRDFNWHNAIGIWSALPLALIAATGLVISYEWANALLFRLAGEAAPARPAAPPAETRAGRGRDARPEPASIDGLDRLWTRAQGQVEGWRSIAVRLPVPAQGPVDVHHRPRHGHAPRPAGAAGAGPQVRGGRALGAVLEPDARPAVAHLGALDPHRRSGRRPGPGRGRLSLRRARWCWPGRDWPSAGGAFARGSAAARSRRPCDPSRQRAGHARRQRMTNGTRNDRRRQ